MTTLAFFIVTFTYFTETLVALPVYFTCIRIYDRVDADSVTERYQCNVKPPVFEHARESSVACPDNKGLQSTSLLSIVSVS
jgi:hypothetical protein